MTVVVVGGGIVLLVLLSSKKDDSDNYKQPTPTIPNYIPTDEITNEYKEPSPTLNISITYNKTELQILDIQKNISSLIFGEADNIEKNSTFFYKCLLGIKNIKESQNPSDTYYEGFFAILNTFYYNETTHQNDTFSENKELNDIIFNNNKLMRNLQKKLDNNDIQEEEQIIPFLKVVFYKNGSYKNIYRPYNLPEKSYNELKEMLDIIIPKISHNTLVDKIDSETIQKKIKEKQMANLKAKALKKNNKIKKLNYIKIKRKVDEIEELNKNGIKVKDKNSTDE